MMDDMEYVDAFIKEAMDYVDKSDGMQEANAYALVAIAISLRELVRIAQR